MKEIKFRYWYGGKMLEVGQVDFFTGGQISVNEELVGGHLMQFTGLKDKNGKEIYEGDIVKYKVCDYGGYDERLIEEIVVIEWEQEEDYSGFTQIMSDDEYGFYPKDVEIIGTIYENPELLSSSTKSINNLDKEDETK